MVWQEAGYESLNITAGDMRTDGIDLMNHRQKCFTAASVVHAAHDLEPFQDKQSIETAFDAAFSN